MGVLLSCSRDALPGEAAAFVICTYDLGVTAVSQAGEVIFGREDQVVGKHLLDLVTSPLGDDQLARHAGLAAQRACDPVVMPLRLTSPKPTTSACSRRASPPAGLRAPRSSRSSRASSGAAESRPRTAGVTAADGCKNLCTACATSVEAGRKFHQGVWARTENPCKCAAHLDMEVATCEVMAHSFCDSHGTEAM